MNFKRNLPSSDEDVDDILPVERRDKDLDLEVLEAFDDFRLTRWFIFGDKSAVEEEWFPTGVCARDPINIEESSENTSFLAAYLWLWFISYAGPF